MTDTQGTHEVIAEVFGHTTDPLAEYDAQFKELDADPFELWLDEQIYTQDYAKGTITTIERRVDQWRDYMNEQHERHPACPATNHVLDFARYYLEERDNSKNTVSAKLGTLSRSFRYFQNEPAFPHPTDFNPFDAAKGKIDLNGDDPKDPRPIPLDELREIIQDEITHVRDRAIIVTQLKLGLRASEASNIKLSEVHIANSEL